MVKPHDPTVISFDTLYQCVTDGRTDGRRDTELFALYSYAVTPIIGPYDYY